MAGIMSYEIVKNTSMKMMMILRHYNEIHVKIINSYSLNFIPNNIFDNYLQVNAIYDAFLNML